MRGSRSRSAYNVVEYVTSHRYTVLFRTLTATASQNQLVPFEGVTPGANWMRHSVLTKIMRSARKYSVVAKRLKAIGLRLVRKRGLEPRWPCGH